MAGVVVTPINKTYQVLFKSKDGDIVAHVRQLNYATRSLIMAQAWTTEAGSKIYDTGKACFLNLKYGLVKIVGLCNEDGSDYELEKEEGADCLTDDCVDAILSTHFENEILYTAAAMSNKIPTEIVDLNTGAVLENVQVIPNTKDALEKK